MNAILNSRPAFVAVFLLAFSLAVPAQQTLIKATGTGRTTGHIANLSLTNATDKPQNLNIGPFSIPSSGQYQPYIVPDKTPVTIPPGGTVKVPLEGYCTDVNLPAPPAGTALPLPQDLSSPSNPDLLDALQRIIEAANALQREGHFTTPFSGNPEKEREAVIQQTFWSYVAEPGKPYGFTEFCDRFRQQWQAVTNPGANPEPSLTEGINQIWNAIVQTGIEAGLPLFQPPLLPPAASTLTPPIASSLPEVTNTITAKGTGRTTGHIADIIISNPTDKPVVVQFGPGSEPFDGNTRPPQPNPLFIPSSGQYQPYLVPTIPPVEIAPGQTVTVPVQGFCTDIHRPPVSSGDGMPPVSEWISPGMVAEPPVAPETMNPPGNTRVVVPTQSALPLDEAINILTNAKPKPKPETALPSPGHTSLSVVDCIPTIVSSTPVIPGTDSPMPFPVNPDQYPALAVPLLADALNRITQTYDQLKPQGGIQTPFSGNPEKEREAVIQQTFWMYSAELSGLNYQKEDFKDNTIRQFEQSSGKPVSQIPQPQQDKIEQGVDDFWNTFEAVGAEAKVLKVPPVIPAQPAVQDFWNNHDSGAAKILPGNTPEQTLPSRPESDTESPPELIKDEKKGKCACGEISFENTIKHTRKGKPADDKKKSEKLSFSNAVIPNRPQTKILDGPVVLAGDKVEIDIENLKTLCADCNGKCNPDNVKIKIQAGELDNNNGQGSSKIVNVPMAQGKNAASINIPDGKLDYGIFIEVTYICKEKGNPRNPCEQATCSDTFILRLKRPLACDCGDVQFAVTLDHKPNRGNKKSDDLNLGEGDVKGRNGNTERKEVSEVEWPDAVGKGDAITLKMKSLTAKCQGCNNTCKPENIKIAVSGANISLKGKEEAIKNPKPYEKGMSLIAAKKVTGDTGEVSCTITVIFDCKGSGTDCAPKACSKDYTIKFKR